MAGPGEIVWFAGIPEVTIGDTVTDPADPRPLARLQVDEPTLSMTFGVNTSPLSGRDGKLLTSRQIKARLEREVLGNVSIEVAPPRHPRPSRCVAAASCSWRCSSSRCVAKVSSSRCRARRSCCARSTAQVHEPYERITVDIPPEHMGTVTSSLAARKARTEQMSSDAGRPHPHRGDHPHAGPRRLPRRVPDRDPGHRPAPPDRRGLWPLGRRGDPPHQRRAGVRPDRHLQRVWAVQPPGARHDVHRVGRRGLRGHGRGAQLAGRATWMSTRPRRRSSPTSGPTAMTTRSSSSRHRR